MYLKFQSYPKEWKFVPMEALLQIQIVFTVKAWQYVSHHHEVAFHSGQVWMGYSDIFRV